MVMKNSEVMGGKHSIWILKYYLKLLKSYPGEIKFHCTDRTRQYVFMSILLSNTSKARVYLHVDLNILVILKCFYKFIFLSRILHTFSKYSSPEICRLNACQSPRGPCISSCGWQPWRTAGSPCRAPAWSGSRPSSSISLQTEMWCAKTWFTHNLKWNSGLYILWLKPPSIKSPHLSWRRVAARWGHVCRCWGRASCCPGWRGWCRARCQQFCPRSSDWTCPRGCPLCCRGHGTSRRWSGHIGTPQTRSMKVTLSYSGPVTTPYLSQSDLRHGGQASVDVEHGDAVHILHRLSASPNLQWCCDNRKVLSQSLPLTAEDHWYWSWDTWLRASESCNRPELRSRALSQTCCRLIETQKYEGMVWCLCRYLPTTLY